MRILKPELDSIKLNSNDILYVNQGALIEGRGIELLLNVFSKLRNTQERKYFLDTLNQGES